MHAISTRKQKKPLCAVKLDMAKAYDRVEWDYFEKMMLKLGFTERWVNIVMSMVRSFKFSVFNFLLLNFFIFFILPNFLNICIIIFLHKKFEKY